MRSSPFFACLALVVTARESAAFDFSEHAHFTARAVALLADEDARYRELLGGIGALLDSRLLCRGHALFMEAPENCFGLADIAGLDIPTGVPLVYELDEHARPIEAKPALERALGDPEAIRAAAEAVARQATAGA